VSDPAQDVFRSLVAERGGIERFDGTQRVIALKLSEMLVSDGAVSAPAILALSGLLPPKPSADEEAWDLSKLNDRELATLDKISRKALGLLPPTPQAPHRFPKRSHRQLYVEETVMLLDQIEAESEHRRRRGERADLSDDDLLLIRNALVWLIVSLPTTPARVFAVEVESAVYAERRSWLDREQAALAAVSPAAPQVEAAAPEPASNVITWGVVTAPRQHVGDRPPRDRPL
jgi:hypothetical protein